MRLPKLHLCLALLLSATVLTAQVREAEPYSRRNTFAVFAEYANDSSHIILGVSPNRKIGAFGFRYERRLFRAKSFAFSYAGEFRPVVLESDPVSILTYMQITPTPGTGTGSPSQVLRCQQGVEPYQFTTDTQVFSGTITTTCGREITFASGLAPVGIRASWRTHERLQPTISSNGGYLLSTRPIPIPNAGSFNFTFEFGAGVEYFYSGQRSVRLEYQIQHLSNHYTAYTNPGVDNGLFKLTYAFGR